MEGSLLLAASWALGRSLVFFFEPCFSLIQAVCFSGEPEPLNLAHTNQFVHNQKAIISLSLCRRQTACKVGPSTDLPLPFSPVDSEYLHSQDSEETPRSIRAKFWVIDAK